MSQSKSLRIFILEDEIHRHPRSAILKILDGHSLSVATSLEQAKDRYCRMNGYYDLVLLDHDMRGFPEPSTVAWSGFHFAKYMVDLNLTHKPLVILHSQNSVGRGNQRDVLVQGGYIVTEFPFSPKYLDYLTSAILGIKTPRYHGA